MVEKEKLENDVGARNGVVAVNPKPKNGVTSKVIDFVEKLIVKWMYDSSQPLHYLSGNFAPVPDETPPTKDLHVIGHLPVITFPCYRISSPPLNYYYYFLMFGLNMSSDWLDERTNPSSTTNIK